MAKVVKSIVAKLYAFCVIFGEVKLKLIFY